MMTYVYEALKFLGAGALAGAIVIFATFAFTWNDVQ